MEYPGFGGEAKTDGPSLKPRVGRGSGVRVPGGLRPGRRRGPGGASGAAEALGFGGWGGGEGGRCLEFVPGRHALRQAKQGE